MAISIDRNEVEQHGGSNPGLTPLDDIHKGRMAGNEPDSETGRLPAQERDRERKPKKPARKRRAKQ